MNIENMTIRQLINHCDRHPNDEAAWELLQERSEEYPAEEELCFDDSLQNCDDWGTGEGRYHGRM